MTIFVTVGNHPVPFNRLLMQVDSVAAKSVHEFFIQTGKTDFIPVHSPWKYFLSHTEMQEKIEKADLIITHGGWGTIEECLEKGKKIIAVPRTMGIEHYHSQEDIVSALETKGNLLGVYDIKTLDQVIEKSKSFNPNPLIKGSAYQELSNFLNAL